MTGTACGAAARGGPIGVSRGARHRVVLAALLLTAGATHAAFVETSASFAASATPFSTSLSVALFDGSLGTLSSVSIGLSTQIVGEIDIFNNTASPRPFTNAFAQIPVTVTASTPDATSFSSVATAALASGTAAAGFNAYSGIASSGSNSVQVLPAAFANYIGPGSGSLLFDVVSDGGSFGGTSAPGLFFGGSATAAGTLTVRYEYEPVSAVPVPAAAWLFGSGLVSLGALWRRRRA